MFYKITYRGKVGIIRNKFRTNNALNNTVRCGIYYKRANSIEGLKNSSSYPLTFDASINAPHSAGHGGVVEYNGQYYFIYQIRDQRNPDGRDSRSTYIDKLTFDQSGNIMQLSAPRFVITSVAINDMTISANTDNRFGSSKINSNGDDVNWSPDWELRWLDFNFSGNRTVRIFHIINKQDLP